MIIPKYARLINYTLLSYLLSNDLRSLEAPLYSKFPMSIHENAKVLSGFSSVRKLLYVFPYLLGVVVLESCFMYSLL